MAMLRARIDERRDRLVHVVLALHDARILAAIRRTQDGFRPAKPIVLLSRYGSMGSALRNPSCAGD